MSRRHLPTTAGMVFLSMCISSAFGAPIHLPVPVVGESSIEPLLLTVPDIEGSYTIPYIQSGLDFAVSVGFAPEGPSTAEVLLLRDGSPVASARASAQAPGVRLRAPAPGEYALRVTAPDDSGQAAGSAVWERVAVGTVIVAIGDSITEGYHGHGFWQDDLDLGAADFPPSAVSRDGRNFPQYAPTTSYHKPEVNCFQSWMTELNDSLAERWAHPVLIANEGFGGITSAAYLSTMRTDVGWQARMRLLQPRVWVIHLGVNDERHNVAAADYAANMAGIVDVLVSEYGAEPRCIVVCRPCYDYVEGAAQVLRAYIRANDRLIAERGLSRGADFYAAYSRDKDKWYGADPVHPNVEGVSYMARLLSEAIVAALPKGASR